MVSLDEIAFAVYVTFIIAVSFRSSWRNNDSKLMR